MGEDGDENEKDKGGHLSLRCQRLGQRIVEGGIDAFDIFMKVLGPIFIIIAVALVGFVSHTFFTVVLPAMASGGAPLRTRVALSTTAVVLLANITYNYAMTICLDPGLPPEYDPVQMEEEVIGNRARESCPSDAEPPRQCGKCGRQKPERAHHCSICKRCVLKMDHHCPWVNNCVGFRNYRHFCLFMWWLAVGCLFIVVMTYDIFLEAMFRPRYSKYSFESRQLTSLATVISACIFFSLVMLGGFHLYLVLTNQTTIEFHGNMGRRDEGIKHGERWRNPYDLGRRRNFQQVFGADPCRCRWLLPCISTQPGDGLHFPTASRHVLR